MFKYPRCTTTNQFKDWNSDKSKKFLMNKNPSTSVFQGIFSFFEDVKIAFRQDTVWYGISACFVFGVVMFYIQGLQPLLLTQYHNEVKKSIIELNQRYSDQVQAVVSLQSNYIDSFQFSQIDACKDHKRYSEKLRDTESNERLKTTLIKAEHMTNSRPYLEESTKPYSAIYSIYSENLEYLKTKAQGFFGIPAFLSYTSLLSESCEKLELQSDNATNAKTACELTKKASFELEPATKPFFWDDVKEGYDQLLGICDKILSTSSASTLQPLKLEYFSAYYKMRSYYPDFASYLARLQEDYNQFQKVIQNSYNELDSILDSRKSIWGMWYILKYF